MRLPEFRSRFAKSTNATWNITLINDAPDRESDVQEKYHVRFRIPESRHLDAIDERFVRTLAREELRHQDLDAFTAQLPQGMPAYDYGAALGEYALGVLLKAWQVPPRSQIGFEEFAAKFKGALHVLLPFNRPVALTIVGLVRFNLNDFADHAVPTAGEVERGLQFFRELLYAEETEPISGTSSHASAICPIDSVSSLLLRACSQLSTGGPLAPSVLEDLVRLTQRRAPTSQEDRSKAHALLAESSLRTHRLDRAVLHLQEIRFDACMKTWAQPKLATFGHDDT